MDLCLLCCTDVQLCNVLSVTEIYFLSLLQVHSAVLDDLVHPTEIVGKRIRYKIDGSKVMKVLLDPKDRTSVEYKLDTFSGATSLAIYLCFHAVLDHCSTLPL